MNRVIYHSITRFSREACSSFSSLSFRFQPRLVRCLVSPNTANERSFFSSSGIIGSLKELLRSGQSFIGSPPNPLATAIVNHRRLVCASARASVSRCFYSSFSLGISSMVVYRVCVKMWLSYQEADLLSRVKTISFFLLQLFKSSILLSFK